MIQGNFGVTTPDGRMYSYHEAAELANLINDYAASLSKDTAPQVIQEGIAQLSSLYVEVLQMRKTWPKELEAATKEKKAVEAFSVVLEGTPE